MPLRILVVIAFGLMAACGGPGPSAQAREVMAMNDLRAIAMAQTVFAAGCGRGGYAVSLSTLSTPAPGDTAAPLAPDFNAAGASITRSQYVVTLAPGKDATDGPADCVGRPTKTAFYAKAEPAPGTSGTRSFAVSAAGAVWVRLGATAPAEPFAAPSTPVR